jgi:hypothetical protein
MLFSRQTAPVIALHVALFISAVVALFMAQAILPLADFPNHLARAFIIHNIGKITGLAEAYQVKWEFAPYVVTEASLNLLQNVMSIYTAGKVIIAASLALIVAGVIAINITLHRTLAITTVLVYPVYFSTVFAFGFVNFLLGLGFALLSYAWWLRFRGRKFTLPLLFALLNINFFIHPISYGTFVLILLLDVVFDATNEYSIRSRLRDAGTILLLAVPQLAFWAFIPRTMIQLPNGTLLGSLTHRVGALLSPTAFSVPDLLWFLLMPTFLFAMWVSYREGAVRLGRTQWRMICALVIISLLVPISFLGISLIYLRLPLAAALLLVAVIGEGHVSKFRRIWLKVSVIAFVVVKTGATFHTLVTCSEQLNVFRTALAVHLTEPGAPILAIQDAPGGTCASLFRSFDHASSLAVIEASSYVPTLFTVIPPIRTAERYRDIEMQVGYATKSAKFFDRNWRTKQEYFQNWEHKFRYVLWLHSGNRDYEVPRNLRVLTEASFFTILVNDDFDLKAKRPAMP